MIKRLFDIFFSFIVLLLFLPFGCLISCIIYFGSKGSVFYRQERVGLKGKRFFLFKFRTMRPNSDRLGQLTVGMKDNRITNIGFFLRKYKIDEFPQFINVLLGDMSIVGPRPEVYKYVSLYSEKQRKILDVRPGITDYASIYYFDENRLLGESSDPEKTYIEEIMPDKLHLNTKYLNNPTLFHDFRIIGLTIKKIIRG